MLRARPARRNQLPRLQRDEGTTTTPRRRARRSTPTAGCTRDEVSLIRTAASDYGRIKDNIIRGGENIAPKEVEDRLREHAVAEVVYGVADPFFGGRRRWFEAGRPAEGGRDGRGRVARRSDRLRADERCVWCRATCGSCQSFR
jgi:hypothetical protein